MPVSAKSRRKHNNNNRFPLGWQGGLGGLLLEDRLDGVVIIAENWSTSHLLSIFENNSYKFTCMTTVEFDLAPFVLIDRKACISHVFPQESRRRNKHCDKLYSSSTLSSAQRHVVRKAEQTSAQNKHGLARVSNRFHMAHVKTGLSRIISPI